MASSIEKLSAKHEPSPALLSQHWKYEVPATCWGVLTPVSQSYLYNVKLYTPFAFCFYFYFYFLCLFGVNLNCGFAQFPKQKQKHHQHAFNLKICDITKVPLEHAPIASNPSQTKFIWQLKSAVDCE